ncbi:MAG TPA: hypothetical protein VEJ45_10170 [Candidatus Acidoferrales bacterium]|nr:hypothetical protein [Candidatus Acidoferrales bacterium]
MKRAPIVVASVLVLSSCVFAQGAGNAIFAQTSGPASRTATIAAFQTIPGPPVVGAPYSATITDRSVQTLADGNRIVQTFGGSTARDSQGRTRQDAPLPNLGNLSAANAPHLVFIQDPVSQASYTLNLTDKTAQKIPAPAVELGGVGPGANANGPGGSASGKFFIQMPVPGPIAGSLPRPIAIAGLAGSEEGTSEDLGSQTMEGVLVNGTRTTLTIPAGQIGNDQPIRIVTEVWTSPDLKTVVYSKRSDPRTGEQTFELTNIVRAEPDASLFTVPSDFKIVDGPQPIFYRPNQ